MAKRKPDIFTVAGDPATPPDILHKMAVTQAAAQAAAEAAGTKVLDAVNAQVNARVALSEWENRNA